MISNSRYDLGDLVLLVIFFFLATPGESCHWKFGPADGRLRRGDP